MRHELKIDDRTLSYLDFGGPGRPLLALHGGMSEGAAFTGLAAVLGDEWRVIAPDQRGHGDSDRAPDHSREGYVADAVALLDHLGIQTPVAVLGYSLGGLNAVHLAAAHPHRVGALIDVDATVTVHPARSDWFGFLRGMRYTAPTTEELLAAAGPVGAQFVAQALRPLPGGRAGGCRSTRRTSSTRSKPAAATTGTPGSRATARRCSSTAPAARHSRRRWPTRWSPGGPGPRTHPWTATTSCPSRTRRGSTRRSGSSWPAFSPPTLLRTSPTG